VLENQANESGKLRPDQIRSSHARSNRDLTGLQRAPALNLRAAKLTELVGQCRHRLGHVVSSGSALRDVSDSGELVLIQ